MHKRSKGITLIELMITVAIVAILASIAYPSYRRQVMRSNRTEAKVVLMEASQSLEKCYTTANTYVGCAPAVARLGNTPSGSYAISAGAGNADITQSTYRLTATAQGTQADDTDCATLALTHLNVRSATKKGGAANDATCWR